MDQRPGAKVCDCWIEVVMPRAYTRRSRGAAARQLLQLSKPERTVRRANCIEPAAEHQGNGLEDVQRLLPVDASIRLTACWT
jgi:hypothetical protein